MESNGVDIMGLTWKNSTGSTITSANVGDEVKSVITFNDDDVVWVYIDWDDGEDNSLEKANLPVGKIKN